MQLQKNKKHKCKYKDKYNANMRQEEKIESDYNWFDPNHVKVILRIAKKTPNCVVNINLVDEEVYSFTFIQDEKIWKVTHTFNNQNDIMVDFKRQPNRYCNRLENISSIDINYLRE